MSQQQQEWSREHNRWLLKHWDEQHKLYFRTHYVEGQGWVFFDWLPVQSQPYRPDSPNEPRGRPASYFSVEGGNSVSTYVPSRPTSEPLHSSYFCRDSSFFVVGKVFSYLFSQAAGLTANPNNDSFTEVKYGEYVHSQIRRFIVVSTRHGFCYGVPILTYNNQGTKKSGVIPSEHAIAYSMGSSYALSEGESQSVLDKVPICIMMTSGVPALCATSRICFGIHYPTQHNVRVKDVGQVHPDHIANLLNYWREQNPEADT